MALYQNPVLQRSLQRNRAKASMRGNRPNEAAIMTEIADRELARKLQFSQLGLQKKRDDLRHKGRTANLSASKKALKDRENTLMWQTVTGAGGAILSHLEGKRRAKKITDREARAEKRYGNMMRSNKETQNAILTRFGQWPMGGASPTE